LRHLADKRAVNDFEQRLRGWKTSVDRWQKATTWHAMSDSSGSRLGFDQRRQEPRGERRRTTAEDGHVVDDVGSRQKRPT